MDKNIIDFLLNQTVLTLSTCIDNKPNCASCFYAFEKSLNYLIIKSDANTTHIKEAILNPSVAGTVLPDKFQKQNVKGIQFLAEFFTPQDELLKKAKICYYKKYPFALAIPGNLWALDLNYIKFTDSTLGFGKKIIWEKNKKHGKL